MFIGNGLSCRNRVEMIRELDSVILTVDLPEHGLKKGDVGTVVMMHHGAGYEVEFITLTGETIAVVSLAENQVRTAGRPRNSPSQAGLTA